LVFKIRMRDKCVLFKSVFRSALTHLLHGECDDPPRRSAHAEVCEEAGEHRGVAGGHDGPSNQHSRVPASGSDVSGCEGQLIKALTILQGGAPLYLKPVISKRL
jgi:hypothetical protein